MTERRRSERVLVGRFSTGHLLVLAAGVLGATATLAALRAADARVEVVVARSDLAVGDRIGADDLGTEEVRADDALLARLVPAADAPDLVGQVVAANLGRGDPILAAQLRTVAAPDGGRAMSFAIDASRAVGGAIEVGDRVDIVAVDRDGAVGYALVDAEVLDRRRADDGAPIRGGDSELTLTVGVDGEGARRLAAALAAGDVTVVRSTGAAQIDSVVWFEPFADAPLDGVAAAPAEPSAAPGPGASDA